jgi:hypothetical protein
VVEALRQEMVAAAEALDFEKAAALRDRIRELTDTELLLRDPRGREQGPQKRPRKRKKSRRKR